jgi:hypothetical protein
MAAGAARLQAAQCRRLCYYKHAHIEALRRFRDAVAGVE